MSRTYRSKMLMKGGKDFRSAKTFSRVKTEMSGIDALDDLLAVKPSNRQKILANAKSGVNPSRDDRKIAAMKEIPASLRGW